MVDPYNAFVVRVKLLYLFVCERVVCCTGRIDVQPVCMVLGMLL